MKPYRLAVFCALLAGAGAAPAESLLSIFTNADLTTSPARRTSIIYIQCHGLGYGDLSCYGQTNFQTPNLDRLATEGIRFTDFRPAGTNFTAALSALTYGKTNPTNNPTAVAARLQAAGYHTGLIGEWTLETPPWNCGFEEFAGFLNTTDSRNYYPGLLWHFDPKNTYDQTTHQWLPWKPDGTPHHAGPEELYPNRGGKHGQYLPELLFNATYNFVRIHQPDEFNKYQPFFLVLNLPAPRSAAANADEFPVPSDAPYSDGPWPQAAKNRAALLTRLDGGIGQLLAQLHQLGLSNNIAIFFSSSEAPEKFTDYKMNFLSPNGAAVTETNRLAAPLPMIVWCPASIPAGRVSKFKWTSIDFMPTALAMSYTKPLKNLDGISILPVLAGKGGPEGDFPDQHSPAVPPNGTPQPQRP